MLCELNIENIAVISQASIRFGRGLNVFTGETGAGKSILLGAIGAILGERTSKDLIRTGENRATVSALFSGLSPAVVAAIRDCAIELEDGEELLLSREITQDHNSCRINGKPATVSMLKAVGQLLINTHGQQDNQMLANTDHHRRFIDGFGGCEELLSRYRESYQQLSAVNREIEQLSINEQQQNQMIDLLRYQINEIESCSLTDGEEEELSARRKLIKNSEQLNGLLSSCRDDLYGADQTEGAIFLTERACDALTDAAAYIPELTEASKRLSEYRYELEDVLEQVKDKLFSLEFDPQELDIIEQRLDTIHKLKRKYGATVADILAFCEKARQQLAGIEDKDYILSQLTKKHAEVLAQTTKLADSLTGMRRSAAKGFVEEVERQLQSLDMPAVVLQVNIDETQLSSSGKDAIEFLLSVNPGESPKPLSKIASGGEMSRIMLAMKNVIAAGDDIGTLIFDEIDAGVSGRAAQKVGAKLLEASAGRQVICVTHLAQVAAFADTHFQIEKQVEQNRTFTKVRELDRAGRAQELARITSGEPITPLALENAMQLLDFSRPQ